MRSCALPRVLETRLARFRPAIMVTPTSTGGYAEVEDTSATREVLDSQAGDLFPNPTIVTFLREGERGHLTPADVARAAPTIVSGSRSRAQCGSGRCKTR